jgi:hypothetical protein
MPIDPTRILSILQELEQTREDELKDFDRELLVAIKRTLEDHKRQVDRMLLRLSFIDEQTLN